MGKKFKILDFDGTLTDEIEEARPFVEKFLDLYSEETKIALDDVNRLFDQTINMIKKDESIGIDFGQNKIVAPAISSQYILYQVAAQKLYSRTDEGILGYGTRIKKMDYKKITEIYYPSYNASTTFFRENAKEFLKKHSDAIIVTNSSTDKVKSKLEKIGCENIQLYGNAKKFLITDKIEYIPETLNEVLDGDLQKIIPRPIYLWRGNYNKVLNDICNQSKEVIVIGDVWEFDNALPMALGYKTITIDNFIPQNNVGLTNYERDIIPTLPDSYVVTSLQEANRLLCDYRF